MINQKFAARHTGRLFKIKVVLCLKKGLRRGRKEEKLKIALAMKKEGVRVAVISRATNLSAAEIRKL